MKILVFGKTGQVAVELQAQADVVALGRDGADLTDAQACVDAIAAHEPDLVINVAAYTAVDKAEEEPQLAMQVNGTTPGAMAQKCAALGVPFVHVSTDYVFNGQGETAWVETDKTAPLNVYGQTKLAGEQAVMNAGGNAAVLRTSWVFSAHGNNFVKTMLRLSETRSELNIVADQIGGPTPARDIAFALLTMGRAMVGGQTGGIFHFGGTPYGSWADFAQQIFNLADRKVAVTGIGTDQYPTPAQRPLNSRLNCAKIKSEFGIDAPDWHHGLKQVIGELEQ